jgi:hypothetical protein
MFIKIKEKDNCKDRRILQLIKILKEFFPDLGLKEARDAINDCLRDSGEYLRDGNDTLLTIDEIIPAKRLINEADVIGYEVTFYNEEGIKQAIFTPNKKEVTTEFQLNQEVIALGGLIGDGTRKIYLGKIVGISTIRTFKVTSKQDLITSKEIGDRVDTIKKYHIAPFTLTPHNKCFAGFPIISVEENSLFASISQYLTYCLLNADDSKEEYNVIREID